MSNLTKLHSNKSIQFNSMSLTIFAIFPFFSFHFFILHMQTHTHQQIRIHIKQTESRQITVCLRFPSDYPSGHLLVELKSVTISGKLLAGLTTLAEQKANEILGKPQVANCCYIFVCTFYVVVVVIGAFSIGVHRVGR